MGLGVARTEHKLDYIENAGKMDLSPSGSPRQEFDRLVPEYKTAKDRYKQAKIEFKEAEVALNEYENKSLLERARHPIKNRRLHVHLRNKFKMKQLAMKREKIQFKAKQREMREIKRTIGNQYRAVKDNEKIRKMYNEILDPANSKYVSMFPAQRQQLDAWFKQYELQYSRQIFSVSKNNGINTYNKLPGARGPEFDTISQFYHSYKKPKTIDSAKEIAEKFADIMNPENKKGNNSKDNSKDNDKDEI